MIGRCGSEYRTSNDSGGGCVGCLAECEPALCSSVSRSAWIARSGQQFVENVCALAQGTIDDQLAVAIQNVESKEGNGIFPQHFFADFLSSQTLLQRGKRPRPPDGGSLVVIFPRDNLAIENGILRQRG